MSVAGSSGIVATGWDGGYLFSMPYRSSGGLHSEGTQVR